MTEISEDIYVVEMTKQTVRLDLPLQIGFFILPLGKTENVAILRIPAL